MSEIQVGDFYVDNVTSTDKESGGFELSGTIRNAGDKKHIFFIVKLVDTAGTVLAAPFIDVGDIGKDATLTWKTSTVKESGRAYDHIEYAVETRE